MSRAARAADGIWWMRTLLANVVFVGSSERWVLVDAGVGGYSGSIAAAAGELFGHERPPEAIILTHGHFDHIGSLERLLDRWDVPIYAHTLELPYLTGRSSYPPPDPLVGGGAMAWASKLYPRGPIDLDGRAQALPGDHSVPGLPGWRWMHTPGHSPGHVSLVRESDGAVIAGDAVTTTKQESLIAVATQRQELHGPPAYFTPDWFAAARSVRALAALDPSVLVTGHGIPMGRPHLHNALVRLADRFEADEMPARGRYLGSPALTDDRGTVWLPPDPLPRALARLAVPVALGGVALLAMRRRRRRMWGRASALPVTRPLSGARRNRTAARHPRVPAPEQRAALDPNPVQHERPTGAGVFVHSSAVEDDRLPGRFQFGDVRGREE